MKPTTLKSLMIPANYPVPTSTVELIQTHVSWIFLTDSHAFKIKKPVDFGFLDFSTLDKRHFYCNEELRLNRRLCPDIYEGVIELHANGDGASFTGSGPILDYAVMMKRLPAERMLERLIETDSVTTAMIERIAGVIADFHAGIASSRYISGFGTLDRIMTNWNENFQQAMSYASSTLPSSELEAIRSWVEGFAGSNETLFARRVEKGYIRECDGDLHLENICLVDDRVYIFDCIEFNERFRFCDTAADIAFLLMDLDFHGRRDLSAHALKTYLKLSGDPDLEELVVFYKIYRAFIRGKVESFRLNDETIDPSMKEIAKESAIRYFRLARGYCERDRLRPTLFITCGTMGCGKSKLADQLAFELGISVYNSDTIRKSASGKTPGVSVHERYGQGLYDKTVTENVYAQLKQLAGNELRANRSVLIDASFKRASDRSSLAALAVRHGADIVILSITCEEEEQKRRLIRRSERGTSVSDGRIELLGQQQADFEPPGVHEGRIITLDS
ncbi:MAG: AAA family ATPase, partial [Deltaproteobacteria bacterium]|nr:AAA family ATPase [Deltaproteobacteria bacterium]